MSQEAKAEAASVPTALDSLHLSIYNKHQEIEESCNTENSNYRFILPIIKCSK